MGVWWYYFMTIFLMKINNKSALIKIKESLEIKDLELLLGVIIIDDLYITIIYDYPQYADSNK
jgi:hypothetical protein